LKKRWRTISATARLRPASCIPRSKSAPSSPSLPPSSEARMRETKPAKERVRDVIEDVDKLDLPDGAYWALIHDRLGLEYGAVFDFIAEDPGFYGYEGGDAPQEGK